MAQAGPESTTTRSICDNVIPLPAGMGKDGYQRWRMSDLPPNAVCIYKNGDNDDFTPAEVMILSLIEALAQRKGLRSIRDDAFARICRAHIASPSDRPGSRGRAITILCEGSAVFRRPSD